MSTHQEHFGRKFYQDKEKGYWISCDYSKERPRCRAHQWVWINNHGKIPIGYHIHHKNEDKSDNRIENLELIDKSRHLRHHMTIEKREKAKKQINSVRHLATDWHKSDKGRAWHKYHALKQNFGNWNPVKYKCEMCSKEFESKKKSNTKFCSNACKSKWRRRSGLDDVIKQCELCKNEFSSNKYVKQKYCSRKCAKNG